ncbi:MAG: autotransporter domain-containing protein [Rickettsiaceae bacterium]
MKFKTNNKSTIQDEFANKTLLQNSSSIFTSVANFPKFKSLLLAGVATMAIGFAGNVSADTLDIAGHGADLSLAAGASGLTNAGVAVSFQDKDSLVVNANTTIDTGGNIGSGGIAPGLGTATIASLDMNGNDVTLEVQDNVIISNLIDNGGGGHDFTLAFKRDDNNSNTVVFTDVVNDVINDFIITSGIGANGQDIESKVRFDGNIKVTNDFKVENIAGDANALNNGGNAKFTSEYQALEADSIKISAIGGTGSDNVGPGGGVGGNLAIKDTFQGAVKTTKNIEISATGGTGGAGGFAVAGKDGGAGGNVNLEQRFEDELQAENGLNISVIGGAGGAGGGLSKDGGGGKAVATVDFQGNVNVSGNNFAIKANLGTQNGALQKADADLNVIFGGGEVNVDGQQIDLNNSTATLKLTVDSEAFKAEDYNLNNKTIFKSINANGIFVNATGKNNALVVNTNAQFDEGGKFSVLSIPTIEINDANYNGVAHGAIMEVGPSDTGINADVNVAGAVTLNNADSTLKFNMNLNAGNKEIQFGKNVTSANNSYGILDFNIANGLNALTITNDKVALVLGDTKSLNELRFTGNNIANKFTVFNQSTANDLTINLNSIIIDTLGTVTFQDSNNANVPAGLLLNTEGGAGSRIEFGENASNGSTILEFNLNDNVAAVNLKFEDLIGSEKAQKIIIGGDKTTGNNGIKLSFESNGKKEITLDNNWHFNATGASPDVLNFSTNANAAGDAQLNLTLTGDLDANAPAAGAANPSLSLSSNAFVANNATINIRSDVNGTVRTIGNVLQWKEINFNLDYLALAAVRSSLIDVSSDIEFGNQPINITGGATNAFDGMAIFRNRTILENNKQLTITSNNANDVTVYMRIKQNAADGSVKINNNNTTDIAFATQESNLILSPYDGDGVAGNANHTEYKLMNNFDPGNPNLAQLKLVATEKNVKLDMNGYSLGMNAANKLNSFDVSGDGIGADKGQVILGGADGNAKQINVNGAAMTAGNVDFVLSDSNTANSLFQDIPLTLGGINAAQLTLNVNGNIAKFNTQAMNFGNIKSSIKFISDDNGPYQITLNNDLDANAANKNSLYFQGGTTAANLLTFNANVGEKIGNANAFGNIYSTGHVAIDNILTVKANALSVGHGVLTDFNGVLAENATFTIEGEEDKTASFVVDPHGNQDIKGGLLKNNSSLVLTDKSKAGAVAFTLQGHVTADKSDDIDKLGVVVVNFASVGSKINSNAAETLGTTANPIRFVVQQSNSSDIQSKLFASRIDIGDNNHSIDNDIKFSYIQKLNAIKFVNAKTGADLQLNLLDNADTSIDFNGYDGKITVLNGSNTLTGQVKEQVSADYGSIALEDGTSFVGSNDSEVNSAASRFNEVSITDDNTSVFGVVLAKKVSLAGAGGGAITASIGSMEHATYISGVLDGTLDGDTVKFIGKTNIKGAVGETQSLKLMLQPESDTSLQSDVKGAVTFVAHGTSRPIKLSLHNTTGDITMQNASDDFTLTGTLTGSVKDSEKGAHFALKKDAKVTNDVEVGNTLISGIIGGSLKSARSTLSGHASVGSLADGTNVSGLNEQSTGNSLTLTKSNVEQKGSLEYLELLSIPNNNDLTMSTLIADVDEVKILSNHNLNLTNEKNKFKKFNFNSKNATVTLNGNIASVFNDQNDLSNTLITGEKAVFGSIYNVKTVNITHSTTINGNVEGVRAINVSASKSLTLSGSTDMQTIKAGSLSLASQSILDVGQNVELPKITALENGNGDIKLKGYTALTDIGSIDKKVKKLSFTNNFNSYDMHVYAQEGNKSVSLYLNEFDLGDKNSLILEGDTNLFSERIVGTSNIIDLDLYKLSISSDDVALTNAEIKTRVEITNDKIDTAKYGTLNASDSTTFALKGKSTLEINSDIRLESASAMVSSGTKYQIFSSPFEFLEIKSNDANKFIKWSYEGGSIFARWDTKAESDKIDKKISNDYNHSAENGIATNRMIMSSLSDPTTDQEKSLFKEFGEMSIEVREKAILAITVTQDNDYAIHEIHQAVNPINQSLALNTSALFVPLPSNASPVAPAASAVEQFVGAYGVSAGQGDVATDKILWARPFASFGRQGQKANTPGYRLKAHGITVGFDYVPVGSGIAMGASLSASHAKVKQRSYKEGSHSNIEDFSAALYGSARLFNSPVFTQLSLTGSSGKQRNHDLRVINAQGDVGVARSNPRYSTFGMNAYLGAYFEKGFISITPRTGVEFLSEHKDSYTESGTANSNLRVKPKSNNKTNLMFDLKLGMTCQLYDDVSITPEFTLGMKYLTNNKNKSSTVSLVDSTKFASIPGSKPSPMMAIGGLSVTINQNQFNYGIEYNINAQKKFLVNTVSIFAKYNI